MSTFKGRIAIIENQDIVEQPLFDLKYFIQERVIYPFTFNVKINHHWLDFQMPFHMFDNNERKTFILSFSVFLLTSHRKISYLLVENFLENVFYINVDEMTPKNSHFIHLHSHDTTHMCYIFSNQHCFKEALEAIVMTSYEALYDVTEDITLLHGLIN